MTNNNNCYTKPKVLRTGKYYMINVAGDFIKAVCTDSKLRIFQYWCPFATLKGEIKLKEGRVCIVDIFNIK